MSNVVEVHCQCQACGGITVFPREMRYKGERPQVHIPFSVDQGAWKCGGCGVVWGFELEIYNATELGAEDSDMPRIEGSSSAFGKVKAGDGGGLSIE